MTVTGKIQKFRLREMAIEELGLEAAAAVETAGLRFSACGVARIAGCGDAACWFAPRHGQGVRMPGQDEARHARRIWAAGIVAIACTPCSSRKATASTSTTTPPPAGTGWRAATCTRTPPATTATARCSRSWPRRSRCCRRPRRRALEGVQRCGLRAGPRRRGPTAHAVRTHGRPARRMAAAYDPAGGTQRVQRPSQPAHGRRRSVGPVGGGGRPLEPGGRLARRGDAHQGLSAGVGHARRALRPREFSLRFLVALAVGLALPFAAQSPAMAASQTASWFAHLADSARGFLRERLRSVDHLFAVYGVELAPWGCSSWPKRRRLGRADSLPSAGAPVARPAGAVLADANAVRRLGGAAGAGDGILHLRRARRRWLGWC